MSTPNLKHFFEQPYKREEWIKVLNTCIGNIAFLSKPPVVKIKTNKYNASAVELGNFKTDEGYVIGLYEVSVPQRAKLPRNKRTLRDLLSLEYKTTVDAALVTFYQEQSGKWRFSYVSEIKTHATDPKRFTYLLGEGEKCKTLADHFVTIRKKYTDKKTPIPLAKLNEVFNVSVMSKEFFKEYRELYGRFTAYLTGEDENSKKVGRVINGFSTFFPGAAEQAKKNARDFVKKMLGRIVFLYFLQKKGWLGVPKDEPWGAGDSEFMSKLFKDCKEPDIFYSEVLVPLFYETLNNADRKDELFKIKSSVFKSGNYNQLKIPYLNGGLFDDDQPKTDFLQFKKELFQDLFSFFDSYNFTVEEGNDRDHTVAVDPEMLGHIFENLLEDNKDKGVFYTPKEIVHYMCRASLVEYLYTALTDKYEIKADALRDKLDAFIRSNKAAEVGDYVEELAQALYDVKICDPAIGSGAFPMGLLKEILEALSALAVEEHQTVKAIWKYKGDFADNLANIKAQIIENSIYGVDIEKGAVDIARLRFWLSLVVDEEAPKPLPNLDYRIVVGNSLVSKFEDETIEIEWNIKNKNASAVEKIINDQQAKLHLLQVRQHEYFVAHAQKDKIRQHIRDLKIDILINQIQLAKLSFEQANPVLGGYAPTSKEIQKNVENKIKIAGTEQLIQKLQRIKQSKNSSLNYFDWKLEFPEVLNVKIAKGKVGFDIVIANPPYIKEYTNKDAFDGFKKSKYYQGKMDIWYGFACKSLDILKPQGIECFIAQNNWITSDGASILRDKILTESEIKLFTDFGNYKVFETAGIQTMIYILKKIYPNTTYQLKYSQLLSEKITKVQLEEFMNFEFGNYFSNKSTLDFNSKQYIGKSIYFNSPELSIILDKIESKANFKLQKDEVVQGLVGAPDEAFVVDENEINYFNREERKLLKNFFTNASGISNKYIFYLSNKIISSLPKDVYPNLYKKLMKYKDELYSRREVNSGQIKWFNLQWPRNEEYFKPSEKIICQIRSERPSFLYTKQDYYVSRAANVIKSSRTNLKYLSLLLNSNLIYFYYKHRGATQGNILKFDKGPLLKIPISVIGDFRLLNMYFNEMDSSVSAQSQNNEIMLKCNHIFYRIYDLTYEEAKVIDPELSITKEEYDAINIT